MKYNVGDKVRIKPKYHFCSVDGFNNINMKDEFFNQYSRLPYCETVMTIGIVNKDFYILKEDRWAYKWTDEMIECKVEEETKPQYEDEIELIGYSSPRQFICPIGYEFRDENDNIINAQKIVLKKKKPKYPTTYEECCKVLGLSEFEYNHTGTKVWYRHRLMATLDKLMLCRDAYWKLYGEEMGLDKPWEPDYSDFKDKMYGLYNELKYTIINPATFVFPTEEMRDAFKENFDPDIEICKEFL